jgi:hypothetical protein
MKTEGKMGSAAIVTLQQAIEKCKKYNGTFCQRNTNARFKLDKNLNVVSADADYEFQLNAWDFDKEWIYEPPKQSAFEKWHKKTGNDNYDTFKECSKNGWNAAIDEVLKLKRPMSIAPGYIVNSSEIKELKEP